MSEWRRVRLGDLVTIRTGKKDANFGSPDGEYPFFTCARQISHCRSYSFDCDAILLAGNCDISNMQRYCGKFEAYQRTYVLTNNDDQVSDIDYIWNCLRLDWVRVTMGKMLGAAIQYIKLGMIKEFEVNLPPLPTQRRIADILSAYDDLIENNRRRIEILEESARTLYRKMFGDGTKWDVKRIEEVCETIGGGTPKTSVAEYWNGDIMWVVPTDITRNTGLPLLNTERKITVLGLQKSSAKMLPPRTILMTSRASIGYFGVCDQAVCTNQGFISIVPNAENVRWYLLYNLLSRAEEIRGYAKGATFAEISKSQFRSMEIVVPDDGTLDEFSSFAEDIYKQTLRLSRQNAKLAEARDMLLPRLMSGKLEVA